ncbi:MAG: hypothetical protein COA39_011050 [Sulfurimonas sp.]|nr:hypothetical protein [Sulfurimonas sp.]
MSMWLTAGQKPTYKTVADFRKDNPKALKQVFKEFILLKTLKKSKVSIRLNIIVQTQMQV